MKFKLSRQLTTTKRAVGRPTDYRREHDKSGYRLALLGLTAKQIGEFFEVSEVTFNSWLKRHPTFRDSIKRGRVQADSKVAEGLYRRAIGCELEQQKVVMTEDGPTIVPFIERIAPDGPSARSWLANRQRGLWSEKPDEKPPGPLINLTINTIDPIEASNIYQRLIAGNG